MRAQILRAGEGETLGPPLGCRDRFLVDSKEWGPGFALVEYLLAPHSLGAPMHVHTREEEFSFVLEGQIWAQLGAEEHVAEVGDLVFKPRGEWHTFWNVSDSPARVLEIIAPGGLEEMYRLIDTASEDEELGPLIAPYGCEANMTATMAIIEKYGLTFG